MAQDNRGHLVLLCQASCLFSCTPRPSPRSLRTWASKGCRGIRLVTTLIGTRRYTSREAVMDFVQALNAGGGTESQTTFSPPTPDRPGEPPSPHGER